ncbi:MAG: AAA family ATPase [Polyangia bacterium]
MSWLAHYDLGELVQDSITTCTYLGQRKTDGARVLIKMCKAEYPSARDVLRLRHEYTLLKELGDKGLAGVPRVQGLESHGTGVALILEALPGRALSAVVKETPLDLVTVLHIGSELAGFLDALHHHQVIHKDIKPQNILYNPSTQQVFVVDFGISTRLSQETIKATNPEALEGTLAYLSPEQTGRMNRPIDARTDFYSLGVTLYELLSGTLPFPATTAMEFVHSHIARRPLALHEVRRSIPVAVSDIVMKLLSKQAEDRYQSGRGLKADLEACLTQLKQSGQILPFPLAQHDRHGVLRIPQRLYGRTTEHKTLLDCFSRVEQGGVELLLIAGYAGVGKSALINEVHKPIARRGGFFVAGKFDQLARNVPYAALAQALRALVHRLLTEPEEELARWRERLLQNVGKNGRLLTELIPELELVIGPQPALPELGATESANRFALTVQNFLHAFATSEHPLVLFLDDLQWADQASLQLLQAMMTDPDIGNLLAIGAYRDNEVERGHPLTLTLSRLREAGVTVREISLPPLQGEAVLALVADTLQAPVDQVSELAALVAQKTQGNPFFINQFLGSLYQERLLTFDGDRGAWRWELERIRSAMVTDNVLSFMLGKLQRLGAATQEVLKLGASIGFEFDLQTLSVIAGRSPTAIAADLWEALRAGLLIPQSEEYRFLYGDAHAGVLGALAHKGGLQVSYRFLHDRVQQAAYRLLAEADRPVLHARIGRLLLAQSARGHEDKRLFEILEHLNAAQALITDPEEKLTVARLCLAASRRAKSAAAYEAATKYAALGTALLGSSGFETEHALSFDLHLSLAESAYAGGNPQRAEALFIELFGRARTNLEHGRVTMSCMALYNTLGRRVDSLRIGKESLARYGLTIADTPEQAGPMIMAGFEAIYKSLGDRQVEELLDAPELTDPDERMILMLLLQSATAGYFIHPTLMVAPMTQHINRTIQLGNCDLSAVGYAAMGSCGAGMFHRYAESARFARLSIAVTERYPVSDTMAQVYFVAGAHTLPYVSHLHEMPELLHRSVEIALQVGDFIYASWSSYQSVILRYFSEELRVVQKELDEVRHLLLRTNEPVARAFTRIVGQALCNLEGKTKTRATLSDTSFDEAGFITELTGFGLLTPVCFYHTVKLQLCYLYGDFATALVHAEAAQALSPNAFIFYFLNELSYYHLLTLHALYPGASPEQRERYDEVMQRELKFVTTLAESSPDNFGHKLLLVQAETARIHNETQRAMELYERAIVAAEQSGYIQQAGLCNELAARFYLSLGQSRTARHYIRDAYAAYRRWGSTAKMAELCERYPQLLLGEGAKLGVPRDGTVMATSTSLLSSGLLDAAMVLRFAQTIAGEIVLPKLIEQFLRIVVMNTGAQRGAMILRRGDHLICEATYSTDPDSVELEKNLPLELCLDVPVSVVQLVARTREPLMFGAAEFGARFASDPYAVHHQPKSLLCLPMLHRGQLTGVLYLENDSASDVFTADRLELLHLLCAQGAIAVENALLYAHVQSVTMQITSSNQELQAANSRLQSVTTELSQSNGELSSTNSRLQSVTAELARSNRELAEANSRLHREFEERVRAEQSRLQLQEEVIRVQNERLAELSTPLIPISSEIMVMPLIGTMDQQRASMVLDTALAGAQSARARVVILDITGMRHIDTGVVATLINTGRALRLLGTEVILTGIRAEVAQTLVRLGIALESLVTRSTLQSGIAYANQLVKQSYHRA